MFLSIHSIMVMILLQKTSSHIMKVADAQILDKPEIISLNDDCEIMKNAKHGRFIIPKNDY